MAKIDYSLKAHVMNNTNLVEIQKKIFRSKYAFTQLQESGVVVKSELDLFNALLLEEEFSNKYPELWHEAEKINHATYERVKRLKDRIFFMLSMGKCIFGTLTFNDIALKTSSETRRRYVTRFLNDFDVPYIANIDFGAEKGREHYHFVILKEFIQNTWKNGFVKFESIRLNDKSTSEKLAKYVSKLTNHAIKETTKRSCVIYSRKFPPMANEKSLIEIKRYLTYYGKKIYY